MKHALAAVVCFGAATTAQAQPSYGYDFVTIGSAGNAPYQSADPGSFTNGRGSVGYEYRISRTEVTTQQWLEFVNTYSGEFGDPYRFRIVHAGFTLDDTYTGPGSRSVLISPSLANAPVFGINWRQAAMYMNWLHNDKQPTLAALQTGAYDTSTFGQNPDGSLTDAPTHLPGARYWIPTLDEWIKAAHYDPNRFGPGQGGYWQSVNSTDVPMIPGLPGVGQTSAGVVISDPLLGERDIPLGAYADQMSPWGLLDLSGGGREWTETLFYPGVVAWARGLEGRSAGSIFDIGPNNDLIDYHGIERPFFGADASFRVASQVPAPGVSSAFILTVGISSYTRRKRR
jgi:sulfatase modifying factor 1